MIELRQTEAFQHVVDQTQGRAGTGGCSMTTARVFKSGNSQAVRLPKEFRVRSAELEIFRRGDELVLREPSSGLARVRPAHAIAG